MTQCPKCQALSGDDWSQCVGDCPMPGSPYYKRPEPKNGGYLPGTEGPDLRRSFMEAFPLTEAEELRAALGIVMDAVDYQRGACAVYERVGAVLPVAVLEIARKALERKADG